MSINKPLVNQKWDELRGYANLVIARGMKSRMKREFHVRICESLRGEIPWATRPTVFIVRLWSQKTSQTRVVVNSCSLGNFNDSVMWFGQVAHAPKNIDS